MKKNTKTSSCLQQVCKAISLNVYGDTHTRVGVGVGVGVRLTMQEGEEGKVNTQTGLNFQRHFTKTSTKSWTTMRRYK